MKRTTGRTSVQRIRITFIKHTQLLLTGVLLTALLALLFGVFSQLPPLDITAQTTSATTIDYSTFLAQIRAGNVVSISFQDRYMEGTLARPLSSSQVTPPPQTKMTPVIATPSLDAAQLVSTRLPGSGDTSLMPLLESKHVAITMLPSAQLPQWLLLLWKFLPFLLLLWMLVWVLLVRAKLCSPKPSPAKRRYPSSV